MNQQSQLQAEAATLTTPLETNRLHDSDIDGEEPLATQSGGTSMTQRSHKERRNSIREIMADESLTPLEKRRNIQSLMDGRRRSSASHVSTGGSSSSCVGGMARAALEAAELYQSDNDDNYSHHSHLSNNSGHHNPYYHTNGAATPTDSEYYGYGYEYPSSAGAGAGATSATASNNQPSSMEQAPLQGGGDNGGSSNNASLMIQSMDANTAGGRKQRASSMPLWSEDTTRAAAPLVAASSNAIWDDPIHISQRMEKSRPPCNHYERNCTIISPCCGLAFGCRICHDECPVLPMPFHKRPAPPPPISPPSAQAAALTGGETITAGAIPQERILNWEAVQRAKHKPEKRRSMPLSYDEYAGGEETHHEIDRFAIAEIICRLCYTRQSSKT